MCCSNIFPVCYTPFSLCSRLSELLILTKSNLPVSPFMYCVLIFLSHHQTSTLETVLNRIKFLNSSKQFVQYKSVNVYILDVSGPMVASLMRN